MCNQTKIVRAGVNMTDGSLSLHFDSWLKKGRCSARKTGYKPDLILGDELRGEADTRYGMNIIARPPADIAAIIDTVRNKLAQRDSAKYWYPSSDLHLTIFEILHSQSNKETLLSMLPIVRARLGELWGSLPMPVFTTCTVYFDPSVVALALLPSDERLYSARMAIHSELLSLGIPSKPRYISPYGHIVFLRYVGMPADREVWTEELERLQRQRFPVSWSPRDILITTGATWYGRRERISEHPASL